MCDEMKRSTNGYHRTHEGSGERIGARIASASWLEHPHDKRAVLDILMEMLWLLQELDSVVIPWEDLPHTASMAQLDDLKIKVANYLCGEGEWREGFKPPLAEYLGEESGNE